MATDRLIEERLAALEAAVQELQQRVTPPLGPDWLDRLIGSQRGEPGFDEVITLGREYCAMDMLPKDAS